MLEPFSDSDNVNYFVQKESVQEGHQEIQHTRRTADKDLPPNFLGLHPDMCQGGRWE